MLAASRMHFVHVITDLGGGGGRKKDNKILQCDLCFVIEKADADFQLDEMPTEAACIEELFSNWISVENDESCIKPASDFKKKSPLRFLQGTR